jgi:hypothetical protein
MKKYRGLIGIIGLLLAIYGLASAIFYSNVTWYSYFTIGGTFFLAYLNSRLKNKSIFEKSKIQIAKIYGIYFLITLLIEFVGRFLLHLWIYPSLNVTEQIINVFLIGYPFAFFFIAESLTLIRKKVHSFTLTIILATLINAFLHEVPNIFAWEWKYTIPYVTFEILQINIVVIVGWIILIAVPIFTDKLIARHR